MEVTFWGVRGSLPTPGPSTVRYGGNTPCVSLRMSDAVLVLDLGTGARELGRSLVGGKDEIYVLLTHPHWDHLMGAPFFQPLYEKGRVVHLLDLAHDGGAISPLDVLDGVHFPVRAQDLPAQCRRVPDPGDGGLGFLRERGLHVSRIATDHPGVAWGYRVTDGRRSVVHLTDNELPLEGQVTPEAEERAAGESGGQAPETGTYGLERYVQFCEGADLLIHDAQYRAEDGGQQWGWGHSEVERVCDLAAAAGVRHLVLFHHDPDRDDDGVDAMLERARERLPAGIRCSAAREGMTIRVGGE